jgi:hypothetical protein
MAWLRQEQATQKPSTEKANKKKEKIKRLQEDEIKSEEGTKSEEKGGDEEHSQRRLIGLAPDFADELRKTLGINISIFECTAPCMNKITLIG